MSIFDLIKAPELTSYWEEHIQDMPPIWVKSCSPLTRSWA